LRELVRQREAAMLNRVLGPEAADRLRSQPKIIGGTTAPASRWRFLVGLLDKNVQDNFQAQFCGGSLIHARFVLTAAHCVEGVQPHKLQVLTGTNKLDGSGTRRNVEAIFVHPNFSDVTFDFDVAVLRLEQGATNIPLVKMITPAEQDDFAAPGTRAMVAGWGDTAPGGNTSFPIALREVTVRIVSQTNCNDANSYNGDITPRMLCAGLAAGGKDSCQGDSGGPLVVRNADGVLELQAGIVSWGDGCALPEKYGVYSRVAVLRSWVRNVMARERDDAYVAKADCTRLGAGDRLRCIDQAYADAQREIGSYMSVIRSEGGAAQGFAVARAQKAFVAALEELCSFEAALHGELGRRTCRLEKARQRAADLTRQLAAIAE